MTEYHANKLLYIFLFENFFVIYNDSLTIDPRNNSATLREVDQYDKPSNDLLFHNKFGGKYELLSFLTPLFS